MVVLSAVTPRLSARETGPLDHGQSTIDNQYRLTLALLFSRVDRDFRSANLIAKEER
jgi:hypothetical protein